MRTEVKAKTIEIRRASLKDRTAVEQISAQIWEGHDYVPNVFDKWVADNEGEFTLVCVDGEVAGFGKLTMLTGRHAWLEGLRMGGGYRGLGLAKLLTRYYIDLCAERGVNSLRLSTFVENYESLHIIETHGFRRIASFKLMMAEHGPVKLKPEAVEVLQSFSEVLQELDKSILAKRSSLLSFDFTFEEVSEELLNELLAEGSIVGIRRDGKIRGLMALTTRHSKGSELSISYMQGDTRADLELLTDYAIATAAELRQNMLVMCPQDETLLAVYLQKGLRKELDTPEPDVFVYEHESTLD